MNEGTDMHQHTAETKVLNLDTLALMLGEPHAGNWHEKVGLLRYNVNLHDDTSINHLVSN